LCEIVISNWATTETKYGNRLNVGPGLKIRLSNAKPNTNGIYEKIKGPRFMLKIANM
jgi:hypothetical protein